MKKLLSVIVTVAMLISCIAPSLVTFAADEPALVIADASFDPAARDVNVSTTVSVANNPGFYYGEFYLYYDSTVFDVAEGAVESLMGEDFDVDFTYGTASTKKAVKKVLEANGVETGSDILCVEIVVEGEDNYVGNDFLSVSLDVVKSDIAEGDEFTFGIVCDSGNTYEIENDDEVELAPAVATVTAVADPNTPVYEDKQFDSTTVYADSVTVNKDVTTVEIGFAVDGTGELIEAYGMNTLVFRIVYPKELKLVSTRLGDVFDAADNGIDLDSQFNFADPSYTPSKEVQDECAWSGYTWEGSDDYIVTAFFSDDDPYYQCKDRGYLAYATFELPEDAKGTYDIKVISCEENFFASVYETTSDVPEPTYIPYVIDDGSITVNAGECKHANVVDNSVAATCVADGVNKTVCADCGETISETVVPALGHKAGDKEIVKAPTTDAEGKYVIKCVRCNEVIEEGVIPAIEALVITLGNAQTPIGSTVELPITVKNNSGMFIAAFDVAYDASVLTFKGFNAGDVFPADAEVYATEYEAGKVRIYFECADVADTTANGLLGNVVFETANDAALVGTSVKVSASAEADNIINVDGVSIETVFENGSVTFASLEATIAVGNVTAPFGKEVVVPVTVEGNPGMFIAIFDVCYDAENLKYIGFTNGDVFDGVNVFVVEYETGKIQLYFEAKENANVTANGALVNLKFAVADNAELVGSDLAVTLAADNDNMLNYAGETFKYTFVDGGVTVEDREKVYVGDAEAKYGDEVVVDLSIAKNPGFFIGIFDVKYDESVLDFDRVVGGMKNVHLLFSGEAGCVRIYVEAIADGDLTADGLLAALAFNIADNDELANTTTDVTVELVEVINYAGDDVDLVTAGGTVTVLEGEKLVVENAEGEYKHNVKVPVSVSKNPGFWAATVEYTFDADAFDFVGVESGLFETVAGESYSCDGNVVTVFVENADVNADVAEDGVLYYLVFTAKAEDSAMAVDANIVEMINAAGEDVAGFKTAAGNVTTVPCDHSEGETYSKVTQEPSATEEGVTTFYCAYCDAELYTETIAKLTAIAVGDAEGEHKHNVKIPVTLNQNPGFWAAIVEYTFDAEVFEFVGVESGLFETVAGESYSCNDNVVTVFVENADVNANVTEDGVMYYLVFAAKTEDAAMTVEANIVEIIDVEANDVEGFNTVAGNVTTVPCDHSEGETYSVVTVEPTETTEGVETFYCAYCDAELYTEVLPVIPAFEGIGIGEATAEAGTQVKVPVSILVNPGVWSIGMEIEYDAAHLEFAGVESGLFAADEANASAANGVITVFVDAADLNDVTEDGVVFYLVFDIVAGAHGTYELTGTVVAENTINAAGEFVAIAVAENGKVVVEGEHVHVPSADAPTCTEDVVCTACGEVLAPATGHKEEIIPGYEATCTETGLTDEIYCSVCNETIKAAEEIPELGHKPGEAEGAYAATCTKPGQTGTVYCTVCYEVISESVEIPALGHDKESEVVVENKVDATCTTEGSYDEVVYCSVCGEELSRVTKTIPVVPHTAGDAVVENKVDATCTTEGSYDEVVYCSVCGEELSRVTKTIPVVPHTAGDAVVENEVDATCTTEGSYDEVVYCTVCGEELSRVTKTTPVVPHTAGDAVVENEVDATCKAEGSYDEVVYCTVCGEELSRDTKTTPVVPHTAGKEVVENEVAADCENDGSYDIVVYCTVCGEEVSREKHTIPATGHDFSGDFVIDKEAEIGVPGEKSKHCLNGCGARSEITEIPALPEPVKEFKLTINGVETVVTAGEVVDLFADKAVIDGSKCTAFDKWVVVSGNAVLDDETANATTFVMPEEDVVIESVTYLVGDVNNDGKVNAMDALLLSKALKTGDATGLVHTDVDGNGSAKINALDVIAIKTILKAKYQYPNYVK